MDALVFNKLQEGSPFESRAEFLETTIYSIARRLFGITPSPLLHIKSPSRRAKYSISLIREKNNLISQLNCVLLSGERSFLQVQLETIKTKLRKLRRGEKNRKKRWKKCLASKMFYKNPYKTGKSVLDQKCHVKLNIDEVTLDNHKSSSVSDPFRNIPLPPFEGLPPAPSIKKPFSSSKLNFSDFCQILGSRRNGSSPGLNQIPYSELFMSSNNHNFNYNSQQDAHEILNSVLDELSGSSRLVNNLISLTVSQTRSCDICVCSSSTYEDHNILSLPVSKSVQSSLNLFLKDEELIGENRVFCPVCEKSQDSTIETKISNCGAILILHLKRFNYVNGFLNKDESVVECLPSTISTKNDFLTIPAIVEDGVSLFNGYTLMATINHSGTTESGHYYAYIRHPKEKSWLLCDDTKVSKVKPECLNNKYSYLFFYARK